MLQLTEITLLQSQVIRRLCPAHQYIGKAFSLIINQAEVKKNERYAALLRKLLAKGLVFARMHPDEKALMIKHLMNDPHNVVNVWRRG